VPGIAYDRALHGRLGPLDETMPIYWDWDWYLRLAAAGIPFRPSNGAGVCVTAHAGNVTRPEEEARRTADLARLVAKHGLTGIALKNHESLAREQASPSPPLSRLRRQLPRERRSIRRGAGSSPEQRGGGERSKPEGADAAAFSISSKTPSKVSSFNMSLAVTRRTAIPRSASHALRRSSCWNCASMSWTAPLTSMARRAEDNKSREYKARSGAACESAGRQCAFPQSRP